MIDLDFEVYKQSDSLEIITEQKIHINSRLEKFHPSGLYSEVIFGPVQKFKCQCGALFGKSNAGETCEKCNVLCGDIEGRSSIFAKIQLPDSIFIINPIFKTFLQQVFGQTAIKSLLNKMDYHSNKETPFYFSLEKHKLLKESKMKANEKRVEFPISDLVSLNKLFDLIRTMDNYKEHLSAFVSRPEFLQYVFIDFILVMPPNSRQIIKISPTKILPHPITKCYNQILKNTAKSSSVSDQLFSANPDLFGYTTYKYQELCDEIYSTILEYNFQKKESYMREALTGKTVEFSQRSVIVPNPALRPYQIGLHQETIKKIFLPELLHYLYTQYENEPINDENYTIIDYIQYLYKSFTDDFQINIKDEDFINFLDEHISDFRTIVERQPTLWKYNTSGYKVANVFGDLDIIPSSSTSGGSNEISI